MTMTEIDGPISQSDCEQLNRYRGLPAGPVHVVCHGGGETCDGTVVRGRLDPMTGQWDFDDSFWIEHAGGGKMRVTGWNVEVSVVDVEELTA